jgi:hypothetical protein
MDLAIQMRPIGRSRPNVAHIGAVMGNYEVEWAEGE